MVRIMSLLSESERRFGALSPKEREFVDHLLKVAPNYSYELSGLPQLDPNPAPGLESAIAAAKAVLEFHAVWERATDEHSVCI